MSTRSNLCDKGKSAIREITQLTERVRFGSFEANLNVGELHKQGIRLKLYDQPFQVLAMLISRPGELVTREEIQQKLWPSGTFVDFENGLNSAVNRLRDALGDSADEPKFIETVPRHGYRFIAPVERVKTVLTMPALEIAKDSILDSDSAPILFPYLENDGTNLSSSGAKPQVAPTLSHRRRISALILTTGTAAIFTLAATLAPRLSHNSPSLARRIEKKLLPVPIVTYGNGTQWLPAFSPDGTRVAYSWSVGNELDFSWYLEVKMLGTETRLRLTKQPAAFPPGPAWSPDGREIAFVRTSSLEDRGIFIISAMGGPERKLRSLAPWSAALQRVVSWSPDGRWIAFADEAPAIPGASPEGRRPNAIYLISPQTLETRQLTAPAADELGDTVPTFSPDGKTIAFVHTTAHSRDEIWTIPVQGGQGRRLVTDGLWTNGLAWASDGQSLVYDRSFAGGFSLWRVPLTGGEPYNLNLSPDRANLLQPALWHDRLAYEAHEETSTVGRVPLDKSFAALPQTPIVSTRHDHAGRLSPSGDIIAFLSDRTGTDELWIADADGANPSQLTHLGLPHLPDMIWAPDGESVAVSAFPGKVYLVPIKVGAPKLIFNGELNPSDIYPETLAFSHDGKFLYLMSKPGNRYELLKVPIDGGPPVKLIDGLFTKFRESQDGQTLFFSRPQISKLPGAPGIWKRPVNGGPEQYVVPNPSCLWDLGPDGIYLVNYAASAIERYSFSGKRRQTVSRLGKFGLGNRLSISPDGRWAFFDHNQRSSVEIEMVEGFR